MSVVPVGLHCRSRCVIEEGRARLQSSPVYISTVAASSVSTQIQTDTHSDAFNSKRNDPVAQSASVTKPTELFWHCTLELLKRRAVTRWSTPWMWRTHS